MSADFVLIALAALGLGGDWIMSRVYEFCRDYAFYIGTAIFLGLIYALCWAYGALGGLG